MNFKTISIIVTSQDTLAHGLDAAISAAAGCDAHLEVVCVGVDATQGASFYAGAPAVLYQEAIVEAQAQAGALKEACNARLARTDIRWSVEAGVAQLGGLQTFVAQNTRFADLVVQPLPYGPGRTASDEAVVEAALFGAGAAVVVLPEGAQVPLKPGRVVIGWNESDEALAAVRRALPLLQRADLVNVAVIAPPSHGPERSDPGGRLTQMLVRHGVHAEVSVLAKTLPRVSDVMIRHLRETGADLLVMGAYGHSRLREALLGGATREMLEDTPVPVLLAR
ncbi:universal stress protein [Roseicitreum antarcticum]|uniref:Nucleotide-binding universal stress protein, UspA family n=1 Tax=Roseicitreum antarcticum TaxID=564137 RepID=A0A1H2RMY2_9RHOB|nr:universal stress protein [Roseicitreum antarcticum]SDW20791.1 Nucleotide-binding universal stress protein, UspA family [Roseicitreum antarcticum]